MIDNHKGIVLHCFYNLTHIRLGKFFFHRRRKHPCQRLCDHNAVCAAFFICLTVIDQECSRLLQHSMNHIRFFKAQDHDLRYIHQTPRQGIWSDHSGKYRTVYNLFYRLGHRIDINAGTSASDRRNFKCIRLFLC